MARYKRDHRVSNIAVNLLGELFGPRTRFIRRRSMPLNRPPTPMMITGSPYISQQLNYSAPLPQQAFSQSMPIFTPSQHLRLQPQLQRYSIVSTQQQQLTEKEYEQLERIDSHYNALQGENDKRPAVVCSCSAQAKPLMEDIIRNKTGAVMKHMCGGCGRTRSRKYHHKHPMKSGDMPTISFCRKCQKDATSSSSSEDSGIDKSPNNNPVNMKSKTKQKV